MRVLDSGEALIEALERESEAFVINAKAMEHGGVEVADVHGVLGWPLRRLSACGGMVNFE